jgi:hypothetical protein
MAGATSKSGHLDWKHLGSRTMPTDEMVKNVDGGCPMAASCRNLARNAMSLRA